MKPIFTAFTLAAGLMASTAAFAQVSVGQPAPAFTVKDTTGKQVNLSDYKGKYVVLEWVNPSCPFVKKHYDGGNMPTTQKYAVDKGVVWLSVSTSDEQGATPEAIKELSAWMKTKHAVPTATLVDSQGKVGRAYGARTTPHMYIVDPQGKLIYAGAIDSKPTSNAADVAGATNYVKLALDEAIAGKPLSQPVTKPYGCTVKYGKES